MPTFDASTPTWVLLLALGGAVALAVAVPAARDLAKRVALAAAGALVRRRIGGAVKPVPEPISDGGAAEDRELPRQQEFGDPEDADLSRGGDSG